MSDVGSGDRLARGAIKATWGVNNVSQSKWDLAFGEDSGPKPNISGSDTDSKPARATRAYTGKTRKRGR
jgi:hypothetical protein